MGFQLITYLTLISIICNLGLLDAKSAFKYDWSDLNFVSSRAIPGKHEVRVAQNGVLAMEFTVPGHEETAVFLRLVSDGEHIVKLIYSDKNTLQTCETVKNDDAELNDFLSKFLAKDDFKPHDFLTENIFTHLQQTSSHFTSHPVHSHSKLTPHYKKLIDIDYLRTQCHENHMTTKQNMREYQHEKHMRASISNNLLAVEKNRRTKRAPGLIYPGTKWCGRGNTSLDYTDLGESRDEDKCCRTHDYCEYMIEGYTRRWGYFNPRFTTISHCNCDDRFMSCLKYLNSPVANMIGDLYYNVAKTECFTFTRTRDCVKRSWWGKCIEEGLVWNVDVKEAMPYEN